MNTIAKLSFQLTMLLMISGTALGDINQIGSYLIGTFATGMDVEGNYAYVGFLDPFVGLRIIDISDPSQPTLVGSYVSQTTGDYPEEVHVVGDTAYVGYFDKGWKILNVADRSHPTLISEVRDVPCRDIFAAPPYVYIAGRWSGFFIYDVSDPAAPVLLSSVPSQQYSGNIFVKDSLAYLSDGSAGLRLFDVKDPTVPVSFSSLRTPVEAGEVAVQNQYVYICDPTGLVIADYADPSSPRQAGFYFNPGTSGVAVSGQYVYVLSSAGGLRALDVSNPSSPTEADFTPFPLDVSRDLKIRGDYAFAIGIGGLITYSLRDTIPPTISTPAEIVVPTDPGKCSAIVNYDVVAEDNLPGVQVSCSTPSGSTFPKGATTVLCTATDSAGNSTTASFTVTVLDREAPTISCPSGISLPCSPFLYTPAEFLPIASDNCDGAIGVTCVPASGTGFPVGISTVTCSATDSSGNKSSCQFNVYRAPLDFEGFLSPLGGADGTGGSFAAPLRTFRLGSIIPVKFVASCGGAPLLEGVHVLQLSKYTDSTNADEPVDATPIDGATSGNEFRLCDNEWHFNLDTGTMSKGVWLMVTTLSDGSRHQAWIQLK